MYRVYGDSYGPYSTTMHEISDEIRFPCDYRSCQPTQQFIFGKMLQFALVREKLCGSLEFYTDIIPC